MQRPTPSPSASASSASALGVAGAVGVSKTIEKNVAVAEPWVVRLKEKVWGKEAAEGKEQEARNK